MRRALLTLALLAAGGCSDAFDPFLEEAPGVALYGVLDARTDRQVVRVEAVARPGVPPPPVAVTLTDLGTGATVAFRDTVLALTGGGMAPGAVGDVRPLAGRTYRLTASRPDAAGTEASAVVTVPPAPAVRVFEPGQVGEAFRQTLEIAAPAGTPRSASVTYGLRTAGGRDTTLVVPYTLTTVGPNAQVLVLLSRDAETIRQRFGEGVLLVGGPELRYALAAPPVAVTGGAGEVGAVAAFTRAWTLSAAVTFALGLAGE